MNYRHAYHAGNFADVVKHVVLMRILLHLSDKPAAFHVIDTHAGAGRYDLVGRGDPEPRMARRHRRLIEAPFDEPGGACSRPISTQLRAQPGRPGCLSRFAVARAAFLREQDRLLAMRAHPSGGRAGRNLPGDRREGPGDRRLDRASRPSAAEGKARPRTLDPSFEDAGEFDRLGDALETAQRKWAGGTYALWYPIKERAGPDALARRLRRSGIAKILRVELSLGGMRADDQLGAYQGLIVVNPPWTLADELAILLPELAAILSAGSGGTIASIGWQAKSSFTTFFTALD